MDIRTPQPSAAAKILRSFFASQGVSVRHTMALEAVARMKGYPSTHAMTVDAPDDEELAAFLVKLNGTTGENFDSENDLSKSLVVVRKLLSKIPNFVSDNFPKVEFAKLVAPQARSPDLPENVTAFSGFTFTVFLESDKANGRIAPYASYSMRVGRSDIGWTNDSIPSEYEFATELSVQVLTKCINGALKLTEVYNESPSTN